MWGLQASVGGLIRVSKGESLLYIRGQLFDFLISILDLHLLINNKGKHGDDCNGGKDKANETVPVGSIASIGIRIHILYSFYNSTGIGVYKGSGVIISETVVDSFRGGLFKMERIHRNISLSDGAGEGDGLTENADSFHIGTPIDKGTILGIFRLQGDMIREEADAL